MSNSIIAALVDDLFFTSKLHAVAREVGSQVVVCRSADSVPAEAGRIVVDLNAMGFDAVGEIAKLKAAGRGPVTAYVSHVQADLIERARAAGADDVLPRSAFVQRLPELLK